MTDAFAYSSGLAAAIGAALSLAAGLVLGAPQIHRWIFLTAAGTFIIYNLDRLRDLERDRSTSPTRTAFVSKHRRVLYGAVLITAIGFASVLLTSPRPIIILCLAIGVVGLFHRRMKQSPALKAIYVSVCWVAACVGLPWLASPDTRLGAWVAGLFLATLTANLIASNLRDDEVIQVSGGHRTILWAARGFSMLSIAVAFAGPAEILPLVWIPCCEGLVLFRFRPTERYGHLAVDGALLLGALATSTHLLWLT